METKAIKLKNARHKTNTPLWRMEVVIKMVEDAVNKGMFDKNGASSVLRATRATISDLSSKEEELADCKSILLGHLYKKLYPESHSTMPDFHDAIGEEFDLSETQNKILKLLNEVDNGIKTLKNLKDKPLPFKNSKVKKEFHGAARSIEAPFQNLKRFLETFLELLNEEPKILP